MSIGTIGATTLGLGPSTSQGSIQSPIASDVLGPSTRNSADGTVQGAQPKIPNQQQPAPDKSSQQPHDAGNQVGNSIATQSTELQTDSLQNQIRAARAQLNNWITAIAGPTPQGQAEIGSLSAQISAAQAQINQLQQSESTTSVDTWA